MRPRFPSPWLAGCAAALFLTPVFPQQATPRSSLITFALSDPARMATAPVAIRSITIDGKPLRLDHPFHVEGPWLRTVVVTLVNVSPRTIVRGGIGLVFPEVGDGTYTHPTEACWSVQGRIPKIVWLGTGGYHLPPGWEAQKPLHLAPGGTLRLTFAADGDAVQAKLAGVTLHQAAFAWETFYFADDARWSAGQYALPPVPGSRQWRMVSPEEFRRSARARP